MADDGDNLTPTPYRLRETMASTEGDLYLYLPCLRPLWPAIIESPWVIVGTGNTSALSLWPAIIESPS